MSLGLHANNSPNLAPIEGLQRAAQRRAQDRSIEVDADWFMQLRTELENENEAVWRDQHLLRELILAFIEGKQLGKRGKNGGWRWVPLPQRTDEPVYSYNLIGFYSENIKAKWVQSNTDVNWRPTSDSDPQQGSAKAATKIHDYYRRKLYTHLFKGTEALMAQCGAYARYYYYDSNAKRTARKPIVQQDELKFGEDSYFCPACGETGPASQLAGMPGGPPDIGQSGAGSLDAMGAGLPGGNGPGAADVGMGAAAPPPGNMPGGTEMPQAAMQPGEQDESAAIDQQLGDLLRTLGDPDALMEAGQMGPQQGFPACPGCGNTDLVMQQAPAVPVESVVGHENYETGDIACESVPVFELKHDLSRYPQDSPYLIRRRRVRRALLQATFPDIQINNFRSEDPGLRAEEELRSSVYGASGPYRTNRDISEPMAEFVQVWLDPCMYRSHLLREPYKTADGTEIPAGTKLIDLFPDGMYQAWVEGIEGVVDLRNEHHKDFWIGMAYKQRAISALGRGLEDMLEGQRQYNLVMSIIYTQLRTSAMPATLFEQKLLPNGISAYLGSLANIPVDSTILDGKRLQDAVFQLQPQPPTQAHFAFGQQMDIFMQKAANVTASSLGQSIGLDNKTATGAQIAAANEQGLFAPQLALKAEVDRRGAELIMEMFRKYTPDQVYVSLSGKRGEQDGMWMSSADFKTDLYAEVAFESYLPQTNLERRERWRQLLMDVGGLPGLRMAMQQAPNLVEQLSELYDVDLGGDDYTAAADICWRRIEQMRQAESAAQQYMQQLPPTQMVEDPMSGQMLEMPIDPMTEAAQLLLQTLDPPVEPEEMGHMAAIMYLRSWLTEDDGLHASQILRAGVKGMIAAHLEGLVREAQIMGMVGMAGQPGALMAPEPQAGAQQDETPGGPPPKAKRPNPNDQATKQIVARSKPSGAGMGAAA